jgi:hypothetical protein
VGSAVGLVVKHVPQCSAGVAVLVLAPFPRSFQLQLDVQPHTVVGTW